MANRDINKNELDTLKALSENLASVNDASTAEVTKALNELKDAIKKQSDNNASSEIEATLKELVKASNKQIEISQKYQNEQKAITAAIQSASESGDTKSKNMYEQMLQDSKANESIDKLNNILSQQNAGKNLYTKLEQAQKNIDEQRKDNKKGVSLKDKLDPNSEYNKKENELLQIQKELYERQAEEYNKEHGTSYTAEEFQTIQEQQKTLNEINKSMSKAATEMSKGATQLLNIADKLGEYKQSWDTRLQGANIDYDTLAKTISNSIGVSPYIKQSAVYEKLNTAISEGITFNVEQRAFLDVLSEGVATTFDAFDGTLKNLVRVQQADSTAYRLGMEASLTKYLNSMYESTEYLSNVSDTVTSNLYQASSLLSAEDAIGTEYQIQKWLGSLYSVGMSDGTIGNISSALGKLLSGDVSVTDSGAGKLLVMAASNSGIDLGTALTQGLDSSQLNVLLQSVVSYLQSIQSEGKDNNVVLSQMASLFEMNVSDLKAASNLVGYNTSIYNNNSNYNASSALASLQSAMNSYGSRMNMATYLGNLKDNMNYTLGGNISSNMGLYGLLYLGNMLAETTGGGNIPTITTLFGGIDLETSIADLMLFTGLGGTLFSSLGGIINGLGQVGNGVGVAANAFGIDTSRANAIKTLLSQHKSSGYIEGDTSYHSYTYQGTSAGDDYTDASNSLVSDTKTNEGTQIEDDDSKDMNDIYDQHNTIIEILNDLVEGNKSIMTRSSTSISSANELWLGYNRG